MRPVSSWAEMEMLAVKLHEQARGDDIPVVWLTLSVKIRKLYREAASELILEAQKQNLEEHKG